MYELICCTWQCGCGCGCGGRRERDRRQVRNRHSCDRDLERMESSALHRYVCLPPVASSRVGNSFDSLPLLQPAIMETEAKRIDKKLKGVINQELNPESILYPPCAVGQDGSFSSFPAPRRYKLKKEQDKPKEGKKSKGSKGGKDRYLRSSCSHLSEPFIARHLLARVCLEIQMPLRQEQVCFFWASLIETLVPRVLFPSSFFLPHFALSRRTCAIQT